jgi:hypothetical protein
VRPNITKGTKAICTVTDVGREDDMVWHTRIVGKDESSMNVEVSRQEKVGTQIELASGLGLLVLQLTATIRRRVIR